VAGLSVSEHVRELVEPLLAGAGLRLWDVEHAGSTLRVTVDRDGGVDLDALAEATRVVSDALDRADPVPGRYTLEVSSPGVDRTLRTPAHFRHTVGADVTVKTTPGREERRLEGRLEAADDEGVVVAGRRIPYRDIERARTTFTWGSSGKPVPKRKKRAKARPGGEPKGRAVRVP